MASKKQSKLKNNKASSRMSTVVKTLARKIQQENKPVEHPVKVKTLPNSNKVSINSRTSPIRVSSDNIIKDIVDVTSDVIGTGIGISELNPLAIAKIPQTIMKVIDVGSNVVKNLSGIQDPQKISVNKNQNISGSNEVLVKELQKHMPVIQTTNLPSAYSSQFTAPPLISSSSTTKNGVRITNIRGSNLFQDFGYASTSAFTFSNSHRLTPTSTVSIFGSRLKAIALNYQRWRLNSFSIDYIPVQATSTSGQIYLMAYNGVDDSGFAAYSSSDVSQHENFVMTNGSQKASLSVRTIAPWLWTFQSDVTDPLKFYYQWVLAAWVSGNANTPAGSLIISYDIDFAQAAIRVGSFRNTVKQEIQSIWIGFAPSGVSFVDCLKAFQAVVSGIITNYYKRVKLSESFSKKPRAVKGKYFKKDIQDFLDSIAAPYEEEVMIESDDSSSSDCGDYLDLFKVIPSKLIADLVEFVRRNLYDLIVDLDDDSDDLLDDIHRIEKIIKGILTDMLERSSPWDTSLLF